MSKKHGKFWRTDPYKWNIENPYEGPYDSFEEAEDWAIRIRKVHSDKFTVIPVDGGFGVEQDTPETCH